MFNSMNAPMQERRMFERFDSRLPAKIQDSKEDYGENIFLRNASAEGVRITNKERYYLKDFLTIEVKILGLASPIPLKGEVIWTKKSESETWDTGIRFHQIPFVQMSQIYEAVS